MTDHATHYVGDSCAPDGHRTDPHAAAELNRVNDAIRHVTTADREDEDRG